MKRQNAFYLAAALALSACVSVSGAARADEPPNALTVDATQITSLGITTAPTEPAQDYLLAVLPAVISPPPEARVAVAATFPGTVIQTLVAEGQHVRRGEALAIIASKEIMTEAAELTQARSRLVVAGANAERLARLAQEGVIAPARADEAKALYEQSKAEVGAKAKILESVGANAAKGTYTLAAPIDGIVAAAKIQTGAPIESMTAPFVVDAGDTYEIQAQVPARLIGKIAPGMQVRLDGHVVAKVSSVGAVIQSDTRSATLKARIDKAVVAGNQKLVAGALVDVAVFAPAPSGAVRMPKAALATVNNAPVVFVRTAKGFVLRDIQPLNTSGTEVVVPSGLAPGDHVAVSGLSELKSIAASR